MVTRLTPPTAEFLPGGRAPLYKREPIFDSYEEQLRVQLNNRDTKLEGHRVSRGQRLDALAQNSVRSTSSILNVLHKTLEARRLAEDQARKAAATSEETIKNPAGMIERLTTEIASLEEVGVEVKRARDHTRRRTRTFGMHSLLS